MLLSSKSMCLSLHLCCCQVGAGGSGHVCVAVEWVSVCVFVKTAGCCTPWPLLSNASEVWRPVIVTETQDSSNDGKAVVSSPVSH